MPHFLLLPLLLLFAAIPQTAAAQNSWPKPDAEELLEVVEAIGADGLEPADYDARALRRDLAAGDPAGWSQRASAVFVHLASDLANGHSRDRRRVAWHIAGSSLDDRAARDLLAHALATHRIRETLVGLIPQHRQYKLLKAALAATPARDKAGIERLRANLERWRWMPRDLGARYVLVNVPAFTVSVVESGRVVERRRVVVGKRSTPTPQFAATISGVIFNPWWDVPQSIVRESVGHLLRANPAQARARGYVVSGGRIRQRPGPNNALGQMKLVMPNPYTVYLHDTPSKALFEEEVRAFSHGCIRVQDAIGLAAKLLSGTDGWSRGQIDRVVAGRRTTQASLRDPIPIYVAYFTAAAEESGEIATFPDIYGRDGPVVESLIDQPPDTHP
jgi:murein L,D-transpeptidase YcbB/YkuD